MAKQRRKRKKKGIGAYHTDRGPENTRTNSHAYEDNPAYEDLTEIQKDVLKSSPGGDIVADYTGTSSPTKRQERLAYKQMKNDGFTRKSVKRIKNARKKYDKNVKEDGFFKATSNVLRAGKDAEEERNKNIDKRRKDLFGEEKLNQFVENKNLNYGPDGFSRITEEDIIDKFGSLNPDYANMSKDDIFTYRRMSKRLKRDNRKVRKGKRKALKDIKKTDKLAQKQEKLREKDIGIYPNSYQRRHGRKQARRTKNLNNPAQRFLSNTIDQVLASNTGSSNMNESPVPSTSSITADDIRSKIEYVANDENKKILNASIDKVLDIINNDPNLKSMSPEDMIDYATDFVNKNTKTATNIIDSDDPYNIKVPAGHDASLDFIGSGTPSGTSTGTGTPSGTGAGTGPGQTVSKVINKQDGKNKKPNLNTDSNLKEIEKNLAASAGGAVDKLDLRDYYPEAGKNIAVGTFTGSRIGSQTIYSGAGMVLPMGMMDARSAAMQKAAQAKITALNDIKESLGNASYQFDQSFQDKGMNMINSYIEKHKSNPSLILADTDFQRDWKKYNSFAESSKEITKLVQEAQLKSVPNDKGEVAAHYTPGQLKEMSDFLNGAKDPDYMNDVLSGKINVGKILASIQGKVQLTKLVDKEFKTLIDSKLERERPFNFTLKQGLTEEEFGEAQDFVEQVKTGNRETSNLYRSAVLKYFDWASEDNVRTMITKLAKDNNINLNDKYGKDYVNETIDYLMAKMPSESFVQNFKDIGNMTKADADNAAKEKVAYWNKKAKERKSTTVANSQLNAMMTKYKNYKGTKTERLLYDGEVVVNANQNDFGLWGVVNGAASNQKKFYTLEEFRNGVTGNGEPITSFINHKEGTGETHAVNVGELKTSLANEKNVIDYKPGGTTAVYNGGRSDNPESHMWTYGSVTFSGDGGETSKNLDANAEFINRPQIALDRNGKNEATLNSINNILTGTWKGATYTPLTD